MDHVLHETLGKTIRDSFSGEPGYKVMLDSACGGQTILPLFISDKKGNVSGQDISDTLALWIFFH